MLLVYGVVLGFLPGRTFFDFQNDVNGDEEVVVGVGGVLGEEGLVHHGEEVGGTGVGSLGTEDALALLTAINVFLTFHELIISPNKP